MAKSAPAGKVLFGYRRNERGATAVAPYSPRARVGAAISMPLAWSELDAPERPSFRVADFANWRTRISKDPSKTIAASHQTITPAMVPAVNRKALTRTP